VSEERLVGGQLAAAISNVVVRRLAEVSGRGPSRARTTLGQDAIFVVIEEALTRAEREVVRVGDEEAVLRMRHGLQRAMEASLKADVEELTGRRIVGFISANHIDPDLAVEVFILEPNERTQRTAEAESDL
jgi:uncharacterized protein YbcI